MRGTVGTSSARVQMYTLISWQWFPLGNFLNWWQLAVLYAFLFQLCFVSFQLVLSCDKIGNAHCVCSKTDWKIAGYKFIFELSHVIFSLQLPQPESTNWLSTKLLLLLSLFLCVGFVCKSFESFRLKTWYEDWRYLYMTLQIDTLKLESYIIVEIPTKVVSSPLKKKECSVTFIFFSYIFHL